MVKYIYRCEACDTTFERKQSMNDPVIKTCPKCDKDEVYRVIGGSGKAPGVIVNLDGFVGGNMI